MEEIKEKRGYGVKEATCPIFTMRVLMDGVRDWGILQVIMLMNLIHLRTLYQRRLDRIEPVPA